MLLWAVCFARKELRPKEAKRSPRRVQSTAPVGASLVGTQEEYRVQITEYSPVGASLVGAQEEYRVQITEYSACRGIPRGCPKQNTARAKGRHKTCPYSAQTPRSCHFEQSEKSNNTAHRELLPFFRGAPRSGEGYKKLDLKALQDDKHREAVILSKAKNLITPRTGKKILRCAPG